MFRRDRLLQEIEALYVRRFDAFVRVARAIVGDRERALEAVHDGFADAIRGREGLRDDAALEAWVWQAVVNASRKTTRKPLVEMSAYREEESAPSEHLRYLAPTLARLPERQRFIIFLRYYADLDYRAIADVLDVTVGTVSAALFAAHTSVRKALEEVEING